MLIKTGFMKQPQKTGILPTLDIDFTREAPWDDRLAFSRASLASFQDKNGQFHQVAANTPRYSYDENGHCKGLVMEEGRTNILYDSAHPQTQTHTMDSGNYILWIKGNGSVTVSGGASGKATQESALRFSLAASASVTFTVSGTVDRFQCEYSQDAALDYVFPTSFIETPIDSFATRAQDMVSFTDLEWFNNAQGTMLIDVVLPHKMQQTMRLWVMTPDNSGTAIEMLYQTEPNQRALVKDAWNIEFDAIHAVPAALTPVNKVERLCIGYKADNFVFATNGTIRGTDTTGIIPTVNKGYIGAKQYGGNPFSGLVRRVMYWDQRLDDDVICKLTT